MDPGILAKGLNRIFTNSPPNQEKTWMPVDSTLGKYK